MKIEVSITPRFDLVQVTDQVIKRECFQFQNAMMQVGKSTLGYMHSMIRAKRKRPIVSRGDNNDNRGSRSLIENIKLKTYIGMGSVGWGIGHIPTLRRLSPHFRVVNYGGFVPGNGKLVPLGAFAPGLSNPNSSSFRNGNWYSGQSSADGKQFTFKAKRAIRPMNYIEHGRHYAEKEMVKVIKLLKVSGGKKV